jgi:hypothetical protein
MIFLFKIDLFSEYFKEFSTDDVDPVAKINSNKIIFSHSLNKIGNIVIYEMCVDFITISSPQNTSHCHGGGVLIVE